MTLLLISILVVIIFIHIGSIELPFNEVTADCKSFPTLYFLFLEERKFLNSHIWESFFHSDELGKSQNCYNYQIIIHDNTPERFVGPKGLDFKLLVNRTSISSCENTLNAMNLMLNEAINFSTVPNVNDVFLFLSSDFVPIKPLHEVYDYFYNHPGQSSFCISPSTDWEVDNDNKTQRIVKHSQFIALTREDARVVTNKHDAKFSFDERYKLLHEFNYDNRRCLDEYWYFAALYGEVSGNSQVPKSGTEGDKHTATSDTTLAATTAVTYDKIALHSTVEQGHCHTYTHDDSYKKESLFLRNIRVGANNHIKNSILYNPTIEFISDLRHSPEFFFLRRIHSEDSNTYVRQFKEGVESQLKLYDALGGLKVLKPHNSTGATHTSSSGPHNGHNNNNGNNHNAHTNRNNTNSINNNSKYKRNYTSHMRFKRGSGDNHGLKVLLVSVDNRPVKTTLDIKDYVSMTAVLQNEYCKRNGYDYISFRTDDKLLEESVMTKFPEILNATSRGFGDKYGRANFHVGYKYFRASSWGKIPPLWYLTTEYGQHYDYIWFVDSDATPNPIHSNISLGDALVHWKTNADKMIYRGLKDPYQALFLFMSNFPWKDDLPCAGTFIFKPNAAAVDILQEWWDYDIPQKNFDDFMEQDALWYTLTSPSDYHFLMNDSILTLLREPQFPSNWFGVCDLWLVHIPNYDVRRNQYFKTMLRMVDRHTPEAFKVATEHIQKHSQIIMNVFDIAEEMETYHPKPYRTQYVPVHQPNGGRADDNFHMPNWGTRGPQPPVATLYNGFIIQQQGQRSIFLVENNEKREFPNMDTMEKMGYDMEMLLFFGAKGSPVGSIPLGPPLPAL